MGEDSLDNIKLITKLLLPTWERIGLCHIINSCTVATPLMGEDLYHKSLICC